MIWGCTFRHMWGQCWRSLNIEVHCKGLHEEGCMKKFGRPQISAPEQIGKRVWEVNLPQGAACGGRGAMSATRCDEALVANRVVPLEIRN